MIPLLMDFLNIKASLYRMILGLAVSSKFKQAARDA